MTVYIQTIIDFIAQHPNWAGLLVFLTAAAESIAMIGMIIPGTTILVGVGAVIGLGHLPLWPILIWAILGAIFGDGVSFWIGHRYRHQVVRFWPFSRRPQLLAQGEAFFYRHGGKSIAIGRFFPVMRAVVPLVAGILDMRPARFYSANILSAIAWAPIHILPGVAIGASMALLGGISSRLLVVLIGSIVLVIAGVWFLRLAIVRAIPMFARAQVTAVLWARSRTGFAPRLVMRALDPDVPSVSTVLLLGFVLVASGIGFVAILEDVVTQDPLVQSDIAISHLIQNLRTSWADNVMVVLTMFGDTVVSVSVAVITLGWLAWRRKWRLAAGFGIVLIIAAGSVMLFKAVLHVSRPILFSAGTDAFSFPSGHATMAAVLYGMLSWLISASLSDRWRWVPLAFGGALIGMIATSRIYLAAHWPSDVCAGVFIGFGLAAVFGLVYRQTTMSNLQPARLASAVLGTLLLVGTWHATVGFDIALTSYARQDRMIAMSQPAWLDGGWQHLPQRRIDLEGETEEPFLLQWAGAVETLRDLLIAADWTPPAAWSTQTISGFAKSSTAATELPALSLLHDGRPPELTLVMPGATADSRTIFRVWLSGFAIETGQGPRSLFLASVIRERIARPFDLVSLPEVDFTADVGREEILSAALSAAGRIVHVTRAAMAESNRGLLLAVP